MDERQLLERYRSTYDLPESVDLTVEQVRSHLELERRLTAELLASTPETRWETFERCYADLYQCLPWLADSGGGHDSDRWQALVGPPPQRIYEVGAGSLARALADVGHHIEATDISPHRGGARPASENLFWSVTDGVHLDRFADGAPYDVVVSDQVVEHLHPDDIVEHFRSAREILRDGGRYIVRTPQRLTGPHDLSPIFGFQETVGMHLREYTNTELRTIMRDAGFANVSAVCRLPDRPPRLRGGTWASSAQLRYLLVVESVLARLGRDRGRRVAAALRGPLQPGVWLIATR